MVLDLPLEQQETHPLLVHHKVILEELETIQLVTKVVVVEDLLLQVKMELVVEMVEQV
jgi:hypothetical protein